MGTVDSLSPLCREPKSWMNATTFMDAVVSPEQSKNKVRMCWWDAGLSKLSLWSGS